MKSFIYLLIFLLSYGISLSAQTFPLEVHVVITTSNTPTTVEQLMEELQQNPNFLFITVKNKTDQNQNFRLILEAKNIDQGFIIRTTNPLAAPCMEISPNAMETYELGELGNIFTINNLTIEGADFSIYDFITDNTLPEGNYEICLTAVDCSNADNKLSAEDDLSCAPFSVHHTQPPYNIQLNGTALCNQEVLPSVNQIMLTWMFDKPGVWNETVKYDVRLYEYDINDDIDPNDLDFIVPPSYQIIVEDQLTQNLLIPDDLVLKAGKKYAVKIQASSQGLTIANNGNSVVCSFICPQDGGPGLYGLSESFPVAESPVLFTKIPIIFKIETMNDDAPEYPVFNQIRKYDYSMQVNGRRIKDNLPLNRSWTKTLNWGDGPYQDQLENIQNCLNGETFDVERARHLVHNSPTDPLQLQRGWIYTANVNGTVKYPLGGTKTMAVQQGNHFATGMPAPKINFPENNDTIAPATPFEVRFTTAIRPANMILAPEYNLIYTLDGEPSCAQFNDHLTERHILQISKNINFENNNIVYTRNEKIGSQVDDHFSFKNLFAASGRKDPAREDALLNEFFKDVTYQLDSLPKGKYFARALWSTDPENADNTDYYNVSEVVEFVIGAKHIEEEDENNGGDCLTTCKADSFQITEPIQISSGSRFKMNGFPILISTITNSSSSSLAGTGIADVKVFGGEIKLKITFSNVKLNTDTVAMAGTVLPVKDIPIPVNNYMVQGKKLLDINDEIADDLYNTVVLGERFLDGLNGEPTGLPFGINFEIADNKFLLAFTDFTLDPQIGKITAITEFKMPDLLNMWMSAGMEACITKNGLSDSIKLFIPNDIGRINTSGDETNFFLSGLNGASNENWATYGIWNCNKDFTLNIAGRVEFSRNILIPELPDGKIDENTSHKVNGKFKSRIDLDRTSSIYDLGLIFGLDITPFQVDGLEDWSMKVNEAYLDKSEFANPEGIQFPQNYDFPGKGLGELEKTWKGLYIKNVTIKTPEGLIGDNNRVSFVGNKIVVDSSGFSSDFAVSNLLDFGAGKSNGGWGISLDTCRFRMLQNNVQEISLNGKMSSPFFAEEDRLKYKAGYSKEVTYNNGNPTDTITSFGFIVTPEGVLHIPLIGSEIQLDDTSYIALQKNYTNNKWEFKTKFAGILKITSTYVNNGLAVVGKNFPSFNYTGVRMEHFETKNFSFTRKPSFRLASPQKSLGNFPITLDEIDVDTEGGNIVASITGTLSLTGESNSLSATAKMSIISQFHGADRKFLKITDGRLDSIYIDATLVSVRVKGYIMWYKNAMLDGIKGKLFVGLPLDIGAHLLLDFGTYRQSPNSVWNTSAYYSYWHIEAVINLPSPIPILPPFSLYSIGGGVYYHMTHHNGIYTPAFNVMGGIELKGRVALDPKKEAFNTDITIGGEINNSGGLSSLHFGGDAWLMKDFSSLDDFGSRRSPSYVWADLDINYTVSTQTLHGQMDVFVHKEDVIWGNMNSSHLCSRSTLHIDPEEWYLYVGTIQNRNKLVIKAGLTIDLNAYLMVGHGIPLSLPPPPPAVLNIINNQVLAGDEGGIAASENTVADTRQDAQMDDFAKGKGFAFGAAIDIDVPKFTFLILYAQFRFMAGFDFNFTKPDDSIFCTNTGSTRGLDGWYASGQLYAAIDGALGIEVDLWKTYSIELVHLKAGIMMMGGGPNPSYFSGMAAVHYSVLGGIVSGSSSFSFMVGKRCVEGDGGALDGIRFIDQMEPKTPASIFSNVTTSFYFPMEKPIILPVSDAEGNITGQETIYPVITQYDLMDNSGNVILDLSKKRLTSDHLLAELVRTSDLLPNTRYKVKIVVKARKGGPGGSFFKDGNRDWFETKPLEFTTGPMPVTIPMSQLFYSAPLPYQQFYLKGEQNANESFVNFSTDKNAYTYAQKAVTVGNSSLMIKYKYEARIVGGGDTIRTSFAVNKGNTFTIAGVDQLENNTKYKLQLVRIKDRSMNNLAVMDGIEGYALSADGINNSQQGPVRSTKLFYADKRVDAFQNAATGSINMLSFELQKEFVFFTLKFKTSKFNTFNEKADLTNSFPLKYNNSGNAPDYYKVYTYWKEPLEIFDVVEYSTPTGKKIPPLCGVFSEIQPGSGGGGGYSSYRQEFAKPYLYNLVGEIDNRNINPVTCIYAVPPNSTDPDDLQEKDINYTCRLNLNKVKDELIPPGNNFSGYKKIDTTIWNVQNGNIFNNNMADLGTMEMSEGTSGPSAHTLLVTYNNNSRTLANAINFQAGRVAIWNNNISGCPRLKHRTVFQTYAISTYNKLNSWINYPFTTSWAYNYYCGKNYPIQFIYRKMDKLLTASTSNTAAPYTNSTSNVVKSFITETCVIVD